MTANTIIRRCSSVVEQRSPKPRVQGSNPCSGAIIYNSAQCAAHSDWQQGVIVSRSGVMLTCDIPVVVILLTCVFGARWMATGILTPRRQARYL